MLTALRRTFLIISAILFLVGVYVVYTGVVSVLSEGYADNIFLGLFFCSTFPVISFLAACYIGSLTPKA